MAATCTALERDLCWLVLWRHVAVNLGSLLVLDLVHPAFFGSGFHLARRLSVAAQGPKALVGLGGWAQAVIPCSSWMADFGNLVLLAVGREIRLGR